jgi:hypothetical protein
MSESERRKDKQPSIKKVVSELTQEQALSIHSHEGFGWSAFIRRPLFQEPQPVLVSPDKSVVALVDEHGELTTDHDIKLRD